MNAKGGNGHGIRTPSFAALRLGRRHGTLVPLFTDDLTGKIAVNKSLSGERGGRMPSDCASLAPGGVPHGQW